MMENYESLPEKNYWLFEIVDFAENKLPEKGIVGKLKLEKLNVKVREELRKENLYTDNWALTINFRGPTDPGLSRLLDKYQKLELFELRKYNNKSIKYNLTEKGRKIKQGYEKYFLKVNPKFNNITNRVHTMLSKDMEKSGKKLVETSEEIKEMKKEILHEKIY